MEISWASLGCEVMICLRTSCTASVVVESNLPKNVALDLCCACVSLAWLARSYAELRFAPRGIYEAQVAILLVSARKSAEREGGAERRGERKDESFFSFDDYV